jgi:hypothetical protein
MHSNYTPAGLDLTGVYAKWQTLTLVLYTFLLSPFRCKHSQPLHDKDKIHNNLAVTKKQGQRANTRQPQTAKETPSSHADLDTSGTQVEKQKYTAAAKR